MKIRLLLNIGRCETEYPHLQEGEHEVSREVGMKLIARGWAVSLDPPPKEIKAVPPPPSIESVAKKATDEVKSYRERQTRNTESKPTANKEQ